MNETSKQFEAVFQEVTDSFADTPDIEITPGKGHPPQEYTITYYRAGVCKEKNGQVTACKTHIISLSLPFGFPQFPPTCIPQSSTFHPDFDSSAINIDDAWQADQSVSKLILHMGRMISGEVYSESGAFNQEAAEWYKANSHSLPFAKSDAKQGTATEETVAEEEGFDTIDTLDDGDFGLSLSPDDDVLPATDPAESHLRFLADRKNYHALAKELQKNDKQFDGRSDLEEKTQATLDEAKALVHKAAFQEEQGYLDEALETLESVEELVADYPDLWTVQQRVQLAQAQSAEEGSASSSSDGQADSKGHKNKEKAPPRKGAPIALGTALVVLGAAGIGAYLYLGSGLKTAEQQFTECQTLLSAGKFTGAKQQCEEAIQTAGKVKFIRQARKGQLTGEINTILNSEKLQQGLAGNTLLDGKYISKDAKDQFLVFIDLTRRGDNYSKQKQWQEAEDSFEKALDAAKQTSVEEGQLDETRNKLAQVQLNGLMAAGEKSLSLGDWDDAVTHLSKALDLARKNPHIAPDNIPRIELLLNQAEFKALLNQGHDLFKKQEWQKALATYQRALDLAQKLDLEEPEAVSDLEKNIARTKVYIAIQKGREAFAAADWDTAIAQYEKSARLLEENARHLGETSSQKTQEKLARIMLHAAIIRDKQSAARYLKADEYGPAIKQLQEIKDSIAASRFADKPEFKTIRKEITAQIKETKRKGLVSKQTAYLTNNYKKLFLKHYPSSAPSALSTPRVEYLKDIGSMLLFRMQCTETTGGRPLRLQMDYLYSPASGNWQFYSEQ